MTKRLDSEVYRHHFHQAEICLDAAIHARHGEFYEDARDMVAQALIHATLAHTIATAAITALRVETP